MKESGSHRGILAFITMACALCLAGCYTIIMHPSVLTKAAEGTDQGHEGDYTSEVNYDQNCLNCHSQAELDDRYIDMSLAGIQTAHGVLLDPYGWRNPAVSIPWWYEVPPPVVEPSPATSNSGAPAGSGSERRRSSGSTRGNDQTRATTNAPAPPPSSSGSAPPPPAASSAPQTASPQQPESTRDRNAGNNAPRRKSGSTRGDDPGH